ncbi:MAG: hypothetical protein NT027_17360 [Proteobacteria bacterium]|nr:hypothetical protein [Pseudomonadota bacterium]
MQSYRNLAEHKPGFIAKTLGLTLEQEKQALEVLESSNAIYKKDGKYFVAMDNKRTDTYADRHLRNRIISHWLKRANEVVEQESKTIENITNESENIWSYRTFASTPQLRQQIREMTVAFYASVRSAIEQYDDSQSDQVSVLSLNLFSPGAN